MRRNSFYRKGLNGLNNLIFLVRTDKGVRDSLRALLLGLVILVLLFNAGKQFILAPQAKKIAQLEAEVSEARAASAGLAEAAAIAPLLEQMQQKKIKLAQEIKVRELELDLHRRHWQTYGSAAGFNQVIFTTGRNAPFSFDKRLASMNMAESRSAGPFTLHPTRITGSAAFPDLLAYLLFLEARPEIGNINGLSLERNPEGRVDFSVVLTRQQLSGQGGSR